MEQAMEAQSNTKLVDNPDSRSKTGSSNNLNDNSSNHLNNNSNSSNNTNSNGNNSDNSAGSGMISLGNNSFGFNFDSEEGVSNLSPPNSDHGGGTKSNTSANVAVSTVGATAVASSSLSNQPQTPPPPLPISQRQKQANDDAAAQTVSKLNAIASQSFISTSSHSNDHNNTNKNNTSNNEELPNDHFKRKSSSGSSGYRSDDEGSGSGNSSEEKQQQCISSKVAMKKQRDMSQQSLTTKNIAQHNVKNEQQDISSSTSLQVAAGTTSVAAGSGSGISETPQQLLQSFSSNNNNDDNTNNIKHEENFNDDNNNNDNNNNDNNDNENPKKKKKIDDQKREERNAREKERSYRIAAQINELRTLLSNGGVIVPKGTKNAVLTEAANYIKMLQEHQYKSEIHRQQLIQQMQMIGSGAIGPQAANAIRHVAAQNGVWSLGKFGGVPPRTAAAHDQQQAQAGLTGVGQQQQSQQGNQQSAFLKSIDDNDYRFIFNSCSIPMAIASMGGAFIDCNQIFIELSQYSKQELLALTIFNLTARSDLQHAFDLVSQMITPPIGNDEDERNMQQQHSPSCVLRGNMKNRTDLGLNITLIRDDDGIAKCFCVSLIKNPASPFDTSMPVHVTPAHVYVQQQQQQGQFQNDGMKQQVGGNNMTSPAFMSG